MKYLILIVFSLNLLMTYASDQFLAIDGQIINRMSIVTVGKIEQSDGFGNNKYHFYIWPTTNPGGL